MDQHKHKDFMDETSDIQKNLIQNIRIRLVLKGLSQKKLAQGMGISVPSLSLKMTGRTSWSLDDVVRVSSFLGIPLTTLLAPPSLTTKELADPMALPEE